MGNSPQRAAGLAARRAARTDGEGSHMPTRRAGTTQAVRPPKPMSPTARKTLATKQLVSALGPDEKAAVTAALEVASEHLAWDVGLLRSLREKYEVLAAATARTQKPDLGPKPVIRNPSALAGHNPLAKTNPYELDAAYEHDQLRRVLADLTQRSLREAVDMVQAREPNSKPPNRTRNPDMIDYIVEHVAGPGY